MSSDTNPFFDPAGQQILAASRRMSAAEPAEPGTGTVSPNEPAPSAKPPSGEPERVTRKEAKDPAIVVVGGTNLLAGLVRAALRQSGLKATGTDASPLFSPDALLIVDEAPALPADLQRRLGELRAVYPHPPAGIISGCDYSYLIPERERGLLGYVHTSAPYDALSHVVHAMIAGGEYVYRPPISSGDRHENPETGPLSAREREICELVKRGCSNKVIARALGLTENSVKVHLRRIMRKVGARSRVAVALYCQSARKMV